MAVENFTTYTEVDPNSKIAVTASRVTWTDLNRDVDAYIYKDKGVDFFAGDFTHELTIRATANVDFALVMAWSLTNDLDDAKGLKDNNKDALHLKFEHQGGVNQAKITLRELDGGTFYTSLTLTLQHDTNYYLRIVRDESVGPYGTLYCHVYFDAARTSLFATLTQTLNSSKKDFRYIMLSQSWNSGHSIYPISGYAENLDLSPNVTSAPSVTTQAASSVDKTTATGNGNITDLGVPSATQHGHVWATHTNPTTDDNKTEKGVPSSTGAYTSSLTVLVPNTKYYHRAYVYYNSDEVFYGIERSFTTDPDVPVVTTNLATSVATTTALGNGSIDNNGGSALTEFGVCWVDDTTYDGGNHPPTTADDKTTEVATNGATAIIGSFASSMTVLSANTLYHYKAYAINVDEGTGYGARQTFTTLVAGAPIVLTKPTINVRTTTATGVGNIVSLGGDVITQYGHVWVTKASFDTSGSPTIDGGTNFGAATELGTGAVGPFASDITGLTDGTTHYVRAYATNSYGTAYGNNDIIDPTSVWGATKGHITILGEYLAYTSRTGKQKKLLGVDF